MSRQGGRGDQPDLGANQQYPPTGHDGFPPQFPYHASQYPNLDTDMNMAETYGQPVQQNLATQLQEAAATAPRNGDVNAMSVNTNGATSAGMAPPQTPHQDSFSAGGAHEGMEDTPDTAEPGNSKRKRSKVSRACDECRRKKVKCDAADLDGSIKTCTNCSKAGLTCEYSRVPMKRGPSKGYIKELSDRVQQVESLQAVLAGQPGYRPSIDGDIAESLYSPDYPMSNKRNFSFSDGRNPFAGSDFQRDRIPSVGGAWTQSPTSGSFRPRDRGSIAIAPDQAHPPTSYPNVSTPYWATADAGPPAAKRQKVASDRSLFKIESKHLTSYYEIIQPELSLLPDLDSAIAVCASASPTFQTFFAVSLALLPANKDDAIDKSITQVFPTADSVWQFFCACIKEDPNTRSAPDNLLFIYTCILLTIHSEYKVTGPLGGISARSNFIKQAMDLTTYLQQTSPHNKAVAELGSLIKRARVVAVILARFYALGTAGTEYVMLESYAVADEETVDMSPSTQFLGRLANIMSSVIFEIQNLTAPHGIVNIQMKELFLIQVRGLTWQFRDALAESPVLKQIGLFVQLLLSRYHRFSLAATVLAPAAQLAEEIAQTPEPASAGPGCYRVLDVHMYTVVVITLLEVLSAVPDQGLLAIAEQALNTIQPVLERKVEQYQQYRSKIEGQEGWDGEEEEGEGKSWMEVLLEHVLGRRKVGWISAVNGGGGNGVDAGVLASGGGHMSVAFDELLRTGYLKVLGGM